MFDGLEVTYPVTQPIIQPNDSLITRLLIQARQNISDPRSWIKHNLTKVEYDRQSFCAIGAIYYQASQEPYKAKYFRPNPYFKEMRKYLKQAIPKNSRLSCIEHYNDSPGTSHTDIMYLFDDAIELSRKTKSA